MIDAIDNKAFEILVREHHRRLIAYSFSLSENPTVAEDITQDALLTAFKRLSDFDASRNFPSWVRGIIRNKYLERCRRYKEIPLGEAQLEYIESTHRNWDANEKDFLTDALDVLEECLQKLPDSYKKAVDYFYMKEMRSIEAAMRLEISDSTMRKRLQRARTHLGDCINDSLKNEEAAI